MGGAKLRPNDKVKVNKPGHAYDKKEATITGFPLTGGRGVLSYPVKFEDGKTDYLDEPELLEPNPDTTQWSWDR